MGLKSSLSSHHAMEAASKAPIPTSLAQAETLPQTVPVATLPLIKNFIRLPSRPKLRRGKGNKHVNWPIAGKNECLYSSANFRIPHCPGENQRNTNKTLHEQHSKIEVFSFGQRTGSYKDSRCTPASKADQASEIVPFLRLYLPRATSSNAHCPASLPACRYTDS
jgi:hypothetical protein